MLPPELLEDRKKMRPDLDPAALLAVVPDLRSELRVFAGHDRGGRLLAGTGHERAAQALDEVIGAGDHALERFLWLRQLRGLKAEFNRGRIARGAGRQLQTLRFHMEDRLRVHQPHKAARLALEPDAQHHQHEQQQGPQIGP